MEKYQDRDVLRGSGFKVELQFKTINISDLSFQAQCGMECLMFQLTLLLAQVKVLSLWDFLISLVCVVR